MRVRFTERVLTELRDSLRAAGKKSVAHGIIGALFKGYFGMIGIARGGMGVVRTGEADRGHMKIMQSYAARFSRNPRLIIVKVKFGGRTHTRLHGIFDPTTNTIEFLLLTAD